MLCIVLIYKESNLQLVGITKLPVVHVNKNSLVQVSCPLMWASCSLVYEFGIHVHILTLAVYY